MAQRVAPAPRGLSAGEFLDLDRRMTDHVDERLVTPDVVLQRRDVEIADQNRARLEFRLALEPGAHFVNEIELVGEFRIGLAIRLVAAGGHIQTVDLDAAEFAAERRRDMAAVAFLAEVAAVDVRERVARDDGDAVVALLAVERDVPVAELLERGGGKIRVGAFRLLQAERVRLLILEESGDRFDAQPDRIDVPSGEREAQIEIPGRSRPLTMPRPPRQAA